MKKNNVIKNSRSMFHLKQKFIRNVSSGITKGVEKQSSTRNNAASSSVKYLGKERIHNFKYKVPCGVNKASRLIRTEGKKNIQMKSFEQMGGKELKSFIDMFSIKNMVALFVTGHLGNSQIPANVGNFFDAGQLGIDLHKYQKTPKEMASERYSFSLTNSNNKIINIASPHLHSKKFTIPGIADAKTEKKKSEEPKKEEEITPSSEQKTVQPKRPYRPMPIVRDFQSRLYEKKWTGHKNDQSLDEIRQESVKQTLEDYPFVKKVEPKGYFTNTKVDKVLEAKKARKKYNKEYYLKNKEKMLKKNSEYKIKNKKKITDYQRKYYLDNSRRFITAASDYYWEHKDERDAYQKEYYKTHKKEVSAYRKQYYKDNKHKTHEWKFEQCQKENQDAHDKNLKLYEAYFKKVGRKMPSKYEGDEFLKNIKIN